MSQSDISVEKLQRAKELFEAATSSPGARRQIAEAESGRDPELHALLEGMLEADEEPNAILDEPLKISSHLLEELAPDSRVGPYQIIRQIGSGGMGAVYLAAGSSGDELVALKLIQWTSPELLHAFTREIAILSSIRHPNIARLVDTGLTEQKTPYLVMEYVDGESIQSLCQKRGLAIRDRIGLVRQLCSAVHYLHQNLIIHRDIKPGNVLVTRDGTVKLVDFGIAKLLESQPSVPLNATLRIMTPDYASPEQVRGLPVTTLTDVYALGLLLFELLAGMNPFATGKREMHQTLRDICETDPPLPSVAVRSEATGARDLSRQLRGELDNIVLKAIRKQPDQRYQSVEQFDDDLARYLNHLPVSAQGESFFYTARKFVSRHRVGVAFATTLLLVLIGGFLAIAYEAGVARMERALAEGHAARAEKQTQVAEEQRKRAEAQSVEAERQREIAERRLAELQDTATRAAQLYSKTRAADGRTDSGLIAQNARESLLMLQRERALSPKLSILLGTMLTHLSSLPPYWHVPNGWSATESVPNEYYVGIDHAVVHSGKSSLVIRSQVKRPTGGIAVLQTFDATKYRGKRVRFAGYLKLDGVSNGAALYLAFTKENEMLSIDQALVSGTLAWQRHDLVVDVPENADSILIGQQLIGGGIVHADDLSFETVDKSVPLTRTVEPSNLGFTRVSKKKK